MQAVSQDYIVTVATTKAPQGLLQIPVLATDRDDAQDKAIDWMEFMGIPHGEVLKVVPQEPHGDCAPECQWQLGA